MKRFLLLFLIVFLFGKAQAQIHKITIYASFMESDCNVNYINYDKLYPDSIKKMVIIDYKKTYQLKSNTYALLLRMNLDGWKLITIYKSTPRPVYLLSREISLDDTAMELYLSNLNRLKN